MTDSGSPPDKSSIYKRDWTQGSISKNLLSLSWPMVLMESFFVISQVVDMVWVGRLGPEAIAGVGIANMVIMIIMAMDIGIIVGVRALVARFIGAGDLPGANHVAGQALILSTGWGLLMTTVGLAAARPVIDLFGVEPEVVVYAMDYMRIMLYGWVAMDVMIMILYVIQSSGDTVTPMLVEGSIRVIHITLCPFLVLGLWVFPDLGVSGAALSNVVTQVLGVIVGLWVLFSGRTRLRPGRQDFRLDLGIMWRILRIGIPALIMNIQRSVGAFILTWLIAPFGTAAVAAHSLVTRVQMFVFLPGMALGMGAGVLVGQNLGAERPERAARSTWLAAMMVEAFMVSCSTVLLLWAEEVVGIFTGDPELIEITSIFARIAAAQFMVMGVMAVLQNCLAGAGDTVPNMVISLTIIWLLQLPLAFLLSRYTSLGVYGVRWAVVASAMTGTIAYIIYFRAGRWRHKKV
jgi:putative MATE family efflux protein